MLVVRLLMQPKSSEGVFRGVHHTFGNYVVIAT